MSCFKTLSLKRRHYQDGSCLVGPVDNKGDLTGDNIAFIYPDKWTALVGRFEKGVMVSAKLARLAGNHKSVPEFVFVPHISDATYKCDVSTDKRISSEPLLPDPYEDELVVVKKSSITGANEGLFTKVDVGGGVILSYYNGVRLNSDEVDTRSWEENRYTIVLTDNIVLDIPPEMTDMNNYCATLGHKANHSFRPNCITEHVSHPRFGETIAIRSKYMLEKGTEVTIDYGYGPYYTEDEPDVPSWYKMEMLKF